MINSSDAEKILMRLEECGYEAWYVGGCVRDSIIGRPIHDIDITTSALPEEIIAAFPDCKKIETGIKHGTVTIIFNHSPYEITTYRIDGSYSDSRRPDSVSFTRNIREDLARRDFTINAMAMDRCGNICDPFGGIEDLKKGIVRCVGVPEERFGEDALRIMRALRFASQLDFDIDGGTSDAVKRLAENLGNISAERIREELDKLIMGKGCEKILLEYREVLAVIIPEFRPCFDFDQHSRYHLYDVYTHIAKAVSSAPDNSLAIRRAMLFHDIGKPPMFTLDENGEGHFKGHAEVSAKMAVTIMKRLKYSNADISLTSNLIAHHSDKLYTEKDVRRLLSKLGEDSFLMLMDVKKSDNMAKRGFVLSENEEFDRYAETAKELVAEGFCLSLSQLAVKGGDMAALGLKGREVKDMLDKLLGLVIDKKLPNDYNTLMAYARENIND